MNTDDIEVGATQPDEVVARINASLNVTMGPVDDTPDRWWAMIDPDYRMSITVAKAWRPDGYESPDSWVVELRPPGQRLPPNTVPRLIAAIGHGPEHRRMRRIRATRWP